MYKKPVHSTIKPKRGLKRTGPKSFSSTTAYPSFLSGNPFCLGNHLQDGNFIDKGKLDRALKRQKKEDLLLGECLVKDKAISEETRDTVLAFQGKVKKFINESRYTNSRKHFRLGQLLVATKLVSASNVNKAVKLQEQGNNKFLGEILVGIGAISKNILALALGAQKKILILSIFAILSSPLTGVSDTHSLVPPPASNFSSYDHVGVPIQKTPYDKRYKKIEKTIGTTYKKVEKYLEMASKFKYKAEASGVDNWQLPFETERLGTGDCDDKAVWLYLKLLKDGVDNVRLVLGNYKKGELSVHMWVNWYQDGQVYILDPTIDNGIRTATQYSNEYYQPFYSFHKDKKWKHNI